MCAVGKTPKRVQEHCRSLPTKHTSHTAKRFHAQIEKYGRFVLHTHTHTHRPDGCLFSAVGHQHIHMSIQKTSIHTRIVTHSTMTPFLAGARQTGRTFN